MSAGGRVTWPEAQLTAAALLVVGLSRAVITVGMA
jgi:hypothetical protein